ncbi:oxidoreductase [Marinospirillum sp. MEB164]|uniref:Oxidoreductase n=1 Tax=Marinospirillum alkalitolerans TaxID=3123374 RepID=A0ABW8PVY9_9GAMM
MNHSSLYDKNIMILGAAGLLGSTLVKGCLNAGANVIAIDCNYSELDRKMKTIIDRNHHNKVHLFEWDVTGGDFIFELLDSDIIIDGAVNSIYPRNKNYGRHFFDVEYADFSENLSKNLGGSFVFLQQCAKYFEKRKEDFLSRDKFFSLVNISSIYGVINPDFYLYKDTGMTMPVEYSAIKSALIHVSNYVNAYIANSHFRVNCVSPGGLLDGQPEIFVQRYNKKSYGKGMLEPKDISGAVNFLLSDASKYILGQNIVIDDGFSL